MKRYSIILFIINVAFTSCDNMIRNANQLVENSSKRSKMVMDSDLVSAKKRFIEAYEKALQSTDSLGSKRIIDLYSKIIETSNYIDSLKIEINKLDNKDLQSSELIKKTFLNDGIGDSVFNKTKTSYSYAIEVALSDTTKLKLKKAKDLYSSETKKQFFELNSPGGVDAILYGIESELIKDGTKSLYNYK